MSSQACPVDMNTYPAHSKCGYTVTQGKRQIRDRLNICGCKSSHQVVPLCYDTFLIGDEDKLIIPRNLFWYALISSWYHLSKNHFQVYWSDITILFSKSLLIRHSFFIFSLCRSGISFSEQLYKQDPLLSTVGPNVCQNTQDQWSHLEDWQKQRERREGFIPQKSIEENIRIIHRAFSQCDPGLAHDKVNLNFAMHIDNIVNSRRACSTHDLGTKHRGHQIYHRSLRSRKGSSWAATQ